MSLRQQLQRKCTEDQLETPLDLLQNVVTESEETPSNDVIPYEPGVMPTPIEPHNEAV